MLRFIRTEDGRGAEAPVVRKCGSPRPCLCIVDVLMNRTAILVLYVLFFIWISLVEPPRVPPARRSKHGEIELLKFASNPHDLGRF